MHGEHNDGYKQALQTHLDHAQYHGYPTYVIDRTILDGLWTKEAALLEMMLEALSKPKSERLRWIFCLCATGFSERRTFVLYTKDWNGLNNGVFMLRVSEWSVSLLSSIVAYRTFKPEEDLPFTEQSAMEKVLELDQYKDGAVECPPRWFNSYPNDGDESNINFHHAPGQLLVHFAGIEDKSKAIGEWVKKLETDREKWEMPLSRTNYEQRIAEFWDGFESGSEMGQDAGEQPQRRSRRKAPRV
ncbi:uncharacterized protein RCC_10623 [Ramularia collo-cygni]|uniref:Uncharacterized protein n=1 Tax=Ramularia collo-cygni TaxID=112498 RepID=A0A2D3VG35_9PEZI|nr:uncharacterized protein RCC_10623 [Ramularia collo-cygni]CZT24895.1 uncharacterized protein RCC_10623 [Ramularia collo-cygni]